MLHESGTHLVKVGHRDGVGHTAAEIVGFVHESFAGARYYFWDGVALLPCRDYRECAGHLNRAERREGLAA